MCTGPFQLDSWKPGEGVTDRQANDAYWDTALGRRSSEIDFKGVPDEATLTSGLLTGEHRRHRTRSSCRRSTQLGPSDEVNVYEGPSFAVGRADRLEPRRARSAT